MGFHYVESGPSPTTCGVARLASGINCQTTPSRALMPIFEHANTAARSFLSASRPPPAHFWAPVHQYRLKPKTNRANAPSCDNEGRLPSPLRARRPATSPLPSPSNRPFTASPSPERTPPRAPFVPPSARPTTKGKPNRLHPKKHLGPSRRKHCVTAGTGQVQNWPSAKRTPGKAPRANSPPAQHPGQGASHTGPCANAPAQTPFCKGGARTKALRTKYQVSSRPQARKPVGSKRWPPGHPIRNSHSRNSTYSTSRRPPSTAFRTSAKRRVVADSPTTASHSPKAMDVVPKTPCSTGTVNTST